MPAPLPARPGHHANVTAAEQARLQRLRGLGVAECAAGDDRGLVWSAYALSHQAHYLDAARDLDAYLTAHPLADHGEEQRTFIEDIEHDLTPRVARLRVIERPIGAVMRAGDTTIDDGLAYFEPGATELTVSSNGHELLARSLTLSAGTTEVAFVELDDRRVFASSVVRVELTPLRRHPGPSPETIDAGVSITPPPVVDIAPPVALPVSRPLHRWAIATTAAAGAFVLAGVAFSIWREDRNST